MGIDLLREHLGTLAVQLSRQRFTRDLTPHPCIVAHGWAARKESGDLSARTNSLGTKRRRQPTSARKHRQPIHMIHRRGIRVLA
jgi:hypothetical protein